MTKVITEYCTVYGSNTEEVTDQVNNKLAIRDENWEPYGSLIYSSNLGFVQAMVKYYLV